MRVIALSTATVSTFAGTGSSGSTKYFLPNLVELFYRPRSVLHFQ